MKFFDFYKKYGVILILVLIVVIFTILNPIFIKPANLLNITRQVSIMAIMSIGMTFVLLSGGIDLSMGAQLSLMCVFIAKLVCEQHWPVLIACIVGVIVATFIGFVDGFLVAKVKVPALIITLGMSTLVKGITYTMCNGLPVYGVPESLKWIGSANLFGVIPVPAILMIIFIVLGTILLTKTYLGRYFYAVGSNESAARLAGLNADGIRIIIYTLAGFLAGFAGVIMLGRIGSGQPNAGTNYEMDVLTACVLGGVSLTGGKGTILRAFVGILIIGCLANGMSLAGFGEFEQMIVKGAVLMAAVIIDCAQNIPRKKKVKELA